MLTTAALTGKHADKYAQTAETKRKGVCERKS